MSNMTELSLTSLLLYKQTLSITLHLKINHPDPALLNACWEQSIAQFQLMQQQYNGLSKWIGHK